MVEDGWWVGWGDRHPPFARSNSSPLNPRHPPILAQPLLLLLQKERFSQRPPSLNKWLPFRLHIHRKCKFWQTSTHLHFNLAQEGGREVWANKCNLFDKTLSLQGIEVTCIPASPLFLSHHFWPQPKLFGLPTHISTLNFWEERFDGASRSDKGGGCCQWCDGGIASQQEGRLANLIQDLELTPEQTMMRVTMVRSEPHIRRWGSIQAEADTSLTIWEFGFETIVWDPSPRSGGETVSDTGLTDQTRQQQQPLPRCCSCCQLRHKTWKIFWQSVKMTRPTEWKWKQMLSLIFLFASWVFGCATVSRPQLVGDSFELTHLWVSSACFSHF